MLNPTKHITQDDEGKYRHKCILFDENGFARILRVNVFQDQSGLWFAPEKINCMTKIYELRGTNNHGVLEYREVKEDKCSDTMPLKI